MFIYYKPASAKNQQIMRSDYFLTHAKDIEKVLQRAVTYALLEHKRLGNPIAILKDGKVVIVPPEEIVVSPEFSDSQE